MHPNSPSSPASPPPAFILVHGTFAPNARWVDGDDRFTAALRRHFGPDLPVQAVHWSGRNRFQDRLAAGARISEAVAELAGRHPDRRVVLVGHSHGGSAIVYALKEAAIRPSVAAVVCLSTPFISLAVRPGYQTLATGLVLSLAAAVASGGLALAGYLTGDLVGERMGLGLALVMGFAALTLVAGRLLAARARRWQQTFLESLERDSRQADNLSTCTPPAVPTMCLKVTGDEVALGLATLQTMASLSGLLGAWVARLMGTIAKAYHRLWGHLPGKFLLLFAAFSAVTIALVAGAMMHDFGFGWGSWGDILNPFSRNWGPIFDSPGVVDVTFRVLMSPLPVILFLVGLFGLVVLAMTGMTTLTFFMFGQLHPLRAALFECSVEQVPEGRNLLLHIPWDRSHTRRAQFQFRLWHSEVYLSDDAISAMCGWIEDTLRQRQAAVENNGTRKD